MKQDIITRKIKLSVVGTPEQKKEDYDKLRRWNEIVFRAANFCSTHLYAQNNIKEFFYFNDDFRVNLSKRVNDDDGVFDTSRPNTIYRMLSEKFKGDCPMDILSNLGNTLYQTFSKESKDYFAGKKSLRSYRSNIPMPFSSRSISNIRLTEDKKNHQFSLFGVDFCTFYGRDFSGNRLMIQRCIDGEYKLCNSSLHRVFKNNKPELYLLATISIPAVENEYKEGRVCRLRLGIDHPIELDIEGKLFQIGSSDEFLYGRISIQRALQSAQINSRYTKGGKGRKRKMQATERFRKKEINYVSTKLHQYTAKVIELCRKFRAGTIELVAPEKEQLDNLLLRNWSYYGLTDKLQYKCRIAGIELKKNGELKETISTGVSE